MGGEIMSKDSPNDNITPDWDNMDDWLADLKSELNMPSDQERPRPVSTAREPVRRQPADTGRSTPASSANANPRPAVSTARPQRPAQGSTPDRRTAQQGTARPQGQNPRQGQPRAGERAAAYEQSRRSAPPRKQVTPEGEPAYRQKRRRQTNVPLIILIVLLVLGMCFAAYQLGSIFLNYHRDRSAYNELAERAISGLAEAEEQGDTTIQATPEPGTDSVVVSEVPFTVDWDYLRSINSDIVGWLYCPNTVINYPVVQSSDHEFYLYHGFDGSSNSSGTLFADRDSVEGIIQSNFIVYGHNMKDDSMFGSFQSYVNRSYYETYPTLYYLTPDANYRIDLFCAHIVESTDDNYPGYFSSISDYQAYLDKVSASAFWVNYDVMSTDYQLFTMSTCTSASGYSDPRLLVQGMMVPIE
jgi:sortase B